MTKGFLMKQALDIAIAGEVEAYKLYVEMAEMVENAWTREAIEALAKEELDHRRKLVAVKDGRANLEGSDASEFVAFDLADEARPGANMAFRDLLAFAIRKEDEACRLYKKLSEVFADPEVKELFGLLAQEEADHRRRFERQYEHMV